jgi:hypothetical protein
MVCCSRYSRTHASERPTLTAGRRLGRRHLLPGYGRLHVVSWGSTAHVLHRVDDVGNRRINSMLFVASVVQHRDLDDASTYIARKLGEGKTRREARRAHKRHLANRVIRRMWKDE